MGKKINFSEKQIQNIIDLYKQGFSQADISKECNISSWSIRRIFQVYNITRKNKPDRFTDEEQSNITRLYMEGKTCEQIATIYGVTKCTISRLLRKNNIEVRKPTQYMRQYSLNENFFDEIDSQEKAYILGILWADGCNFTQRNLVRLALQSKDRHILDSISKLLESDKPLQFVKGRSGEQDTYALNIVNKHMSQVLDELGMHNAKSLILEFPKWLDKTLYPAFIRGYYDGDGGLSKKEHTYRVQIVGTFDVCDSIMKILNDIGVTSKIYNTAYNDVTKSLYIGKKDNVKNFLDYLYNNATIYLQRKYDLYISKYYPEDNINNTQIV